MLDSPKYPLRIGTYDDPSMLCDAAGVELFSLGFNEDTREITPHGAMLLEWLKRSIGAENFTKD